MSSHTLPKMLFACWRCSKFLAGKFVQPRFHVLSHICQEFGTLSFHSRCVCVHAMRLGFQHLGIGSFFLWRSGFPCLFLSSNRWIPSAMAISRVYSGGYHHEGLHIGFHVRLRHHLPRRARATRPKRSSEHRSLETPWGSPQQMRASHRTQQASAVRGTSRGHFATGRAHIKGFAVGRLSFARTDRRDPRLCLDSTIAHVDAKVWIEEKSFNPCVEDIASAKVVSHSSEGVGLTIDVTKAHPRKRFSFSFESDNSAAIGNMHLLWSAPPGMSYQLAQSGVGTTSKMDWARHQFLLVFLANHERKKGQSP